MTEETSVLIKPILEIERTVQELERLVDAKSTEVAQLKLRAMLLEESDTDAAALRQQLDVAVREAQRWREKAEAAESKARIFQEFTRRIRSIHSSLAVGEGSRISGDVGEVVSTEEDKDAQGSYRVHRVRFPMGPGDGAESFSITSNEAGPAAGGSTETEGEVAVEEVDDGRELTSTSTATPLSSEQGAPYPVPPGLPALPGLDGVVSPAAGEGRGTMDLSSATMAMWVATQELLMMEDEETSSHTPGISTVSTDGSFSESFAMEDQW
ncbi:hypothetical protein CCMA1212_009347 [Trichoderma ghanense]|uniref:Uncharacterized protein n=1 Tax=Trichoderma ghanense TaxID=65468 RepID=A0ABY2GT38_9HYPO